jgi:hypothetical protein
MGLKRGIGMGLKKKKPDAWPANTDTTPTAKAEVFIVEAGLGGRIKGKRCECG